MVAQTPSDAVANANGYTTCKPGLCLAYSRTWLEIGSRDPSAAAAWHNADRRHPGDRSVPKGAPVFWLGGSRGFGHIALCTGPGESPSIRSTDVQSSGRVSTVPLSWFDSHWPSLHYAGWAEDLNGILIPYLDDDPGASRSRWAHGDVYVAKLQARQRDSDSVARLCYRLSHHSRMPSSHRPRRVWRGYNVDVVEAVRFWQRRVRPNVPGPDDGTSLSNRQANVLFGPNYEVHEK